MNLWHEMPAFLWPFFPRTINNERIYGSWLGWGLRKFIVQRCPRMVFMHLDGREIVLFIDNLWTKTIDILSILTNSNINVKT